MRIHREGYKIILITVIACIAIWLLVKTYIHIPFIRYIFLLGLIILLLWVVRFFRFPRRKINFGEHILSSADGKIVAIEEVMETEYFNEKRMMISVFMSPFDVHINWYPFDGQIKYSKYHPGWFLIAHHPKSSEFNECTTVVLENAPGKDVLVRQVAGIMARRIVCYAVKGDYVRQGEELGIIRFGSRVDFFLPLNVSVKVNIGDKVRAQRTVLAVF